MVKKTIVKAQYCKFHNRSYSVIECECWYQGESNELLKSTRDKLFFKPLYVYEKGNGVGIYYNILDNDQAPNLLWNFFNNDQKTFFKLTKEFEKNCKDFLTITDFEFNALLKKIKRACFMTVVCIQLMLAKDKIDLKVLEEAKRLRYSYHQCVDKAVKILMALAIKKLPSEYRRFINFITLNEISGKLPAIKELKEREKRFILYNGKLIVDKSIAQLSKQNNWLMLEANQNNDSLINGSIACKGKVRGRVKLVFEISQSRELKKGEILVSPMTTPDFISAMDNCAAIVTDEGGLTCHAAIVARELGKPCIIGTKIGTKVLKNGDLVEVDANKGVVRKLSIKLK